MTDGERRRPYAWYEAEAETLVSIWNEGTGKAAATRWLERLTIPETAFILGIAHGTIAIQEVRDRFHAEVVAPYLGRTRR